MLICKENIIIIYYYYFCLSLQRLHPIYIWIVRLFVFLCRFYRITVPFAVNVI